MALDTFFAYAGVYGKVEDALADYDAVHALHTEIGLIDAYDAAVKINPSQGALYLTNETKIFYSTNQTDASVVSADKAIALDPNSAILYYLKASGLVGKSTQDPKTSKLIAPPGCLEAYQKYLQLDPNGAYATDVKSIIASFNQTIDNSYKAPKKKS